MRKAIIASVAAWCAVTVTASAAVLKVPSEYPRIQAAIDAAAKGDTVLVSPGVYYETINFGGKDIVVTSTDPNDPRIVGYTIINADGDGTVVTFENRETNAAVLQGFTITGGFGTLEYGYESEDGTFSYKYFYGAGILCRNGASPVIAHNVIANNRGPYEYSSTMGEYHEVYSYGGGIMCTNSNALISHNIVKGNYAAVGGGIAMEYGQLRVIDNLIYDNAAVWEGGGVYMYYGWLLNNTIVANSAGDEQSQGEGGNLYVSISPTDENSYAWNNVICDAPLGGGVVWYQEPPLPGLLAFNDVWNNAPGNYGEYGYMGDLVWDGPKDLTGTWGNISADPLFANPAAKDFHLTPDSPCIDAGNPERGVLPGEHDWDRAARLFGAGLDLGADEFVGYVKPQAKAGPDRHILEIGPVTLDGRASYFYDPCGVKNYRWAQVGGPAVVLDDPNQAQPMFTAPVEGEYVFQLAVADDRSAGRMDQVLILVSANQVPVANAGPEKTWQAPGVVTLDGTNSFDPDQVDRLTYQWKQVSGPPLFVVSEMGLVRTGSMDMNTPRLSFYLTAPGTYEFELVVRDGFSASVPNRVRCVGVGVKASGEYVPQPQLDYDAYYPDLSGTTVVYSAPASNYYDYDIVSQDLISGRTETFGAGGVNLQPKIDGNLVVWWGGPSGRTPGPDCTSVWVRQLATGVQRELRSRSNSQSYSHPAVSGNKVVWLQHVGLDRSSPATWADMPYDICGVDLSNFDKPVYFTIATKVGQRDPYPYENIEMDYDHVLDISGNIVVWEGNGDIYAADISDLAHIKIVTVCNQPARQYDPSISGHVVVWTDERNDRGDIYGADLSDWEHPREFEVAKGPGTQGQPMIDGCHIVYADGSRYGGEIMLACLTRQHGVLSIPAPNYLYGAQPVLEGMTLLWTQTNGWYLRGQMLQFGYSMPEGRVQNTSSATRAGRRYDYIQHALCDANDGDVIVANPDRYEEKISFVGKGVTVRSRDPNDLTVVEGTILTSPGNIVSFLQGEQAASVLRGFTIAGGCQGILCNGASPTITQCTICGSAGAGVRLLGQGGATISSCRILGSGAAGVELTTASEGRVAKQGEALLRNCIIAGNGGAGVHGGKPSIINCTVVENRGVGISAASPTVTSSIVYFNNSQATKSVQIDGTRAVVSYSDVQGGRDGEGNLNVDPLFAALGRWTSPTSWVAGDYHLQSQGWRWSAAESVWTSDDVTSPCIDAGDPASDLGQEPAVAPNDTAGAVLNQRIDMGAYGGTAEASLAPAKP